MQCNIDARGKAVRFVVGAVFEAAGILMLALAFAGVVQSRIAIGAAIAAMFAGLFMVWQGYTGWCAIRAMGFRTRF